MGIVLLAGALLVQAGCDRSRGATGSVSDDDGGTPSAWQLARIQSPLRYTSTENVRPSPGLDATPQLLGDGRVVYPSFFGDGSWQIVLSGTDGENRRDLTTSADAPGFSLSQMLYVPEAHGVVALLSDSRGFVPARLELVPLDGSSPVVIDSGVIAAQVSASGLRINYVRAHEDSPSQQDVCTSTVLAPSPQVLGTIESDWLEAQGHELFRGRSVASDAPFFYLIAGSEGARAFGIGPANAPASITVETYGSFFEHIDATTNGRLVSLAEVLVDTTTGAENLVSMAAFSPDHTRVATMQRGSDVVTVTTQDGAPTSLALHGVSRVVWSPDSRVLLELQSSGGDGTYGVFDVATATETAHVNPAVVATAVQPVLITRDDAHVVTGATDSNGYWQLASVELATGSTHILSHDGGPSNPKQQLSINTAGSVVDTGNGLLFADGWALRLSSYDGTTSSRLDTPRAGETHDSLASVAGASALVAWDAPTGRALFETVVAANVALSSANAPYALASTSIAAPGTQFLTRGSKTTGQILPNFALFAEDGVVLFDSKMGSLDTETVVVLSSGSLAGGSAAALDPDPRASGGSIYGEGTFAAVASPFGPSGSPTGYIGNYNDEIWLRNTHEARLTTHGSAGDVVTTEQGYRALFVDSTRQKALVSDETGLGYVVSLLADGAASAPVATGVKVIDPSAMYGCEWFDCFGSRLGGFTRDGKLLVNRYPYSVDRYQTSFLVDLGTTPATSTELGLVDSQLLPDGETIVGTRLSSGDVAITASAAPMQQTLYHGTLDDVSRDGRHVLITDGDSGALLAVRISDLGATTVATPSPTGTGSYSGSFSPDGARAFVREAMASPCPGSWVGILTDLDGTHRVTHTFACDAGYVVPSGDYRSFLNVLDGVLYGTLGARSFRITSAGERVIEIWPEPGTDRVVVQAIDAEKRCFLFEVHADGSGRKALGEAFPRDRHVDAVQLAGGYVYVNADALELGVKELFRFAL